MAVFGAILMYIISMLSLFQLRRTEPNMVRPFRRRCYPYFPAFALLGAWVCMATMIYYNPLIFGLFVGIHGNWLWLLPADRPPSKQRNHAVRHCRI